MRRLGIIGSGPAAFYTAQKLLKSQTNLSIDMFEKLPIPFGLIRYGVAPDHPEVKNVINTFTTVCQNDRFRYFGNINVGTNIRINEMRKMYDFILLAYGASVDKKLNIPGENLKQVYSASDIVGWYNGLPEKDEFYPDLSGEECVIIGHGNVALDIARILLTPIDLLKKTDIPDKVLSQLLNSRMKKVTIIGRRGPLQVSYTIKEFRELIRCPRTKYRIDLPDNFNPDLEKLARPRRRLTSLIIESCSNNGISIDGVSEKEWNLIFLKRPVEIKSCDKGNVSGVLVEQMQLQPDGTVKGSGSESLIKCNSVIKSIGYRSIQIDPDIPLDKETERIIPNRKGRVLEENEEIMHHVYCVGWVKRGPTGVILDTISDSKETSDVILEDLDILSNTNSPEKTQPDIVQIMKDRGVRAVTFADWKKLDELEIIRGQKKGKPREKLTNINEILKSIGDKKID